MPRGDPSEGDIVEAEGLGHGTQVALLCFMDRTIGLRDVEQAVEDILQQSRFVAKRRRHLSRIGLEPGRGALGEVEQPLGRQAAPRSLTWMTLAKASTSEGVTTPSDFAILAASATRPVVKTTSLGVAPKIAPSRSTRK